MKFQNRPLASKCITKSRYLYYVDTQIDRRALNTSRALPPHGADEKKGKALDQIANIWNQLKKNEIRGEQKNPDEIIFLFLGSTTTSIERHNDRTA